MKKLYLLIVTIGLFWVPAITTGQNMMNNPGVEMWDDPSNLTDWDTCQNISQETTIVYEGTYSAAHTSASSQKILKQIVTGFVPGQKYVVSYRYFDNDTTAKTKLAAWWIDETGATLPDNEAELRPTITSSESPDWQQYSVVVTVPPTAVKLRFIVKVVSQGGYTGGKVYYDDFYIAPLGANYFANPGMELWTNATTPTDWNTAQNISQESTIVLEGTYSAAHTSASTQKVLKQVIKDIQPGEKYILSYWYLDNDTTAKSKLVSYWLDGTGANMPDNEIELRPTSTSSENPDWKQYTVVMTAPAGAVKLKFLVKVLSQASYTGGKVYYDNFYFGNPLVVHPEPSNYPTKFSSSMHILLADLEWTPDATGPQIPDGYLITGAKDGFTASIPVDGTPVADDLDWSDGVAAVNVGGDINSYDFTELDAATGYTFTIYPYSNLDAFIDYKTNGTPPSATGTTANATMIDFEGFESGTSGSWSTYNVSGDQTWIFPEFNEKYTAKIYGQSGGTFYANEDWLISPALDLSGYDNAYYSFKNMRNGDGNLIQLMASTDYDGVSDPNTATWDDITDMSFWSLGSYQKIVTDDIDLGNYTGGTVYIAFKYTSTDLAAVLYKLDNMQFYSYPVDNIQLNLTVFLEGPYTAGGMSTALNSGGYLPKNQPFNKSDYNGNPTPVWQYSGGESVNVFPSGAVDWVLVQLRDAADAGSAGAGTVVAEKAAFLQDDGSIVSLNGGALKFHGVSISQNMFVVIYHRNHLGIMSSVPLVGFGGVYVYDFTSSATKAYGTDAQKDLGGGVFGMYADDANADGTIDENDKTVWDGQAGVEGYRPADFNMSGQVDNPDKNDYLLLNDGKSSQIPN